MTGAVISLACPRCGAEAVIGERLDALLGHHAA
jgi:hypothetical protein